MSYLLQGGELSALGSSKAITTIQAWAEHLNQGGTSLDNAASYKQSTIANRCIDIRANTLSQIPWALLQGDEPVEASNPYHQLLSEVNPEMNGVDLWRTTESDLLIHGQAFWLKIFGSNAVKFLQRLNPATMRVKRNNDGTINFFEQVIRGQPRPYAREQIVFFHEYDPEDDFAGVSKTQVARRAIDMDVNAELYVGAFFQNYAMPPVLLTTEQQMNDADFSRFQRWWNRTFRGARKQHKVGVADRGLKPTIVGYPLKDLALETVRQEARRAICMAYGVPPAIAGAWEAANFATIEVQRTSMYEDTVIPRAEYLAGVINAELSPHFAGLFFDWRIDELPIMQPDQVTERMSMAQLVREGIITAEAAALRLGFEDNEVGEGRREAPNFATQPDRVEELNKYQKKAENALRQKGSADVDFEALHIEKPIMEYVGGKLKEAKSKKDVQRAFAPFL